MANFEVDEMFLDACEGDNNVDADVEVEVEKPFGEPIYEEVVFEDTRHQVFRCQVDKVFNAVENWAFNRILDEAHVDKIHKDIVAMKYPHLIGSIKIIQDAAGKKRIIDGQHRLSAIRKIMQTDIEMKWPSMQIMIEVYHVPDVNDSDEAIMLYHNANKNLNVKEDDMPKAVFKDLMNAIVADPFFKGKVVDKDLVYKPSIAKKVLHDSFKLYFKPSSEFQMTTTEIVQKIKEINNNLRLKSDTELFSAKATQIQKNKARNMKFYLNIEQFPPEKWIPYIYNGQKI
jgi:hypothetical protein